MVSLHKISRSFIGSGSRTNAISALTLDLQNRDFTLVIGANGSGKSTLLNLFSGEIMPDFGSLFIDGEEITKWPAHKRASLISRIFQDPRLGTASELSILDNLRLASLRSGTKTLKNSDTTRFRKKIKDDLSQLKMGLEDRIESLAGNLSGGQRQALSLIMAIQSSTRLLLLDEPLSALDPPSASRITDLLKTIHSENNIAIVMVSHNMHESLDLGNRLIQLSKGKIYRDIIKSENPNLTASDLYQWIGEAEEK